MPATTTTRLDQAIAAAPAQQLRYALHALQGIANGVPMPGRYAEQALKHITAGTVGPAPAAPVGTPRSDRLEATRLERRQDETPAYDDALRLCRALESEVARLTAALAQANEGFERFERKSYLLGDRVEKLEAALERGADWMDACVNEVLVPVAQEATPTGATAEGLGGSSVSVIRQARDALSGKIPV
ncbi:hypothetical protein [Paraburkholderia sp. A3RO-2L]|jgi:hypothetical protein|uniref:hypothetical protein n=1 Tax=unclassified Paraburkholderia TaxID=2615204 RepID=UPI003DA95D1F